MGSINVIYDIYHNIPHKCTTTIVDWLYNVATPSILINFFWLIFLRCIGEELIFCRHNAYESYKWTNVINSFCFVQKIYFVSPYQISFPSPIDDATPERNAIYIEYYPWVPVVLLLQCIFFCVPYWWWNKLTDKNNLFIDKLSNNYFKHDPSILAHNFIINLKYNYLKPHYGIFKPTTSLSYLYLLYKFLNLVNIVAHLFFLQHFLNFDDTYWGIIILFDLINGYDWTKTGHFPLEVYCDFPRRDDITGMTYYSTSECCLSYNKIYELMFVFEWMWLALIFVIGLTEFILFIFFIHSRILRIWFVEKYLGEFGIDRSSEYFYKFVDTVLEKDGMICLKILSGNCTFRSFSHFFFDVWEISQEHFPLKKTLFLRR